MITAQPPALRRLAAHSRESSSAHVRIAARLNTDSHAHHSSHARQPSSSRKRPRRTVRAPNAISTAEASSAAPPDTPDRIGGRSPNSSAVSAEVIERT